MAIGLLKIGEIKNKPTSISHSGDTVNPFYVFSGSVNTTLYDDITSNKNWMTIGCSEYDYMFCRNQVMSWTGYKSATMGGFSALTTEDQQWAAKSYAVGQSERDSVYTNDELGSFWKTFIGNAQKCRQQRWVEAKGYISFILPAADSIDLAKSTNNLSHEFITYGIESYAVDGSDGLFDWVGNTSSYSGGTGFSGKTYWSMSAQTNIMDIIKDGVY